MIVGSALGEAWPRERRGPGGLALSVRGLAGRTVRGLDVDVRSGEVVGLSGILGSGREHVAALLSGALPRSDGDVAVAGVALPASDPRAAICAGVAYALAIAAPMAR